MTMVALPSGAGYSAAFIRGPRSLGDTNAVEEAGAVIVKRAFTIVGGALTPDAAGEAIVSADTFKIVDGNPWVLAEGDLAAAKRNGDLIVLGGRAVGRGGAVIVNGSTRLQRIADPGEDVDLADNLFGWQPRFAEVRSNDARMFTGGTSTGDRFDRFQNAQRRVDGHISLSVASALPTQANITITHSKIAPEAQDPVLLSFSYTLPPLALTLFLHEKRGPDRETRWCPHVQGTMTFDTLVVRPGTAKAVAVWRKSWRWGAPGADTLRRAVVTEGAA